MKKLLALALALVLTTSMAACSGGTGQGTPADSSGTQDTPSGSSKESAVTLTGEIGGEISVSCYDTLSYKAFLEGAAMLFEQQHPGTKVNVETFSALPETKSMEQDGEKMTVMMAQDDPQGRADYISKVNTSLMSGGGADILAMDVLPVYKYAESGHLEDLSAYMDADPGFNRADYRTNILDAVRYHGGTWFVPMDYSFNYYTYDSTLLPVEQAKAFASGGAFTYGQLIDIGASAFQTANGTKMFGLADYSKMGASMFGQLLEESYGSFVDMESKTGSFTDGSFATLLNTVKEYAAQGYVSQGASGGPSMDAGEFLELNRGQQEDRFFFKPKNNFSLLGHFNRDSGRNMMINIGGMGGGLEDDDEIAGIQANKDGGVPFTYSQAYGINSSSANKETAWAFIKFLMGEEMQLSTSMMPMGLPVNNSARQQKAELMVSGAYFGAGGTELGDAEMEVLRKYSEAIEQLSDQINAYQGKDSTIYDMIAAEVGYFFDGSKTADEVSKVLQSKVDLYLNE